MDRKDVIRSAYLPDAAGGGHYLFGLLGGYDGAGAGKGKSPASAQCDIPAG